MKAALPWILILVVALAALGFLAWLGYDNWYTFEDVVK
jgi:hypothetical protein